MCLIHKLGSCWASKSSILNEIGIGNFVIAVLCVGSGRLRFHSDSSWMQHVCGRVSSARDRWLGVDVAEGGSPNDDHECQTWASTQDLLTSQFPERVTHSLLNVLISVISYMIVICQQTIPTVHILFF